MTITWQSENENTVVLNGKLSQSTVPLLFPIKKKMQQYNDQLTVDLAQLSHVDSAGLAYLIELQQYCQSKKIKLQYKGATTALSKLIALYNAEPLLQN
jgi:phospholipid transport system transporter-binding protein